MLGLVRNPNCWFSHAKAQLGFMNFKELMEFLSFARAIIDIFPPVSLYVLYFFNVLILRYQM